jgi:hypothetical protein
MERRSQNDTPSCHCEPSTQRHECSGGNPIDQIPDTIVVRPFKVVRSCPGARLKPRTTLLYHLSLRGRRGQPSRSLSIVIARSRDSSGRRSNLGWVSREGDCRAPLAMTSRWGNQTCADFGRANAKGRGESPPLYLPATVIEPPAVLDMVRS